MRFHWLRARAFVHATEDEEKVKQALLWLLAQDEAREAYSRIHRQRSKGHYGNEILVLEFSLKKQGEIEAAVARIFGDANVRGTVVDTLLRRLDEDDVLHVRIDKQTLVGRTISLREGSDAVVITMKAALFKDQPPPKAWATFLREAMPTSTPSA